MRYTRGKRIWAMILTLCLILSMIPTFVSQVEVEANALSVSSLTCSGFISNATARNYIDTMMRYYINNNSNLQSTLNSGKDVIFMFEGGSDNYWNGSDYTNSAYDTRNQAVVIVVKLDSNSNAYVHYYSENCSSIPGDPTWCTSGVAYDGSVTIYDGVYRFYRWNHTGPYAAFQLDVPNSTAGGYGYYTPLSNPNGERMGCSGINIHTRASNIAAGSDLGWAWSEGCQVIGTGDTSTNEFNAFFKAVMGVTWNPWVSYYSSPKQLYTYGSYGYGQGSDWTEGYYVVDRQLALMNASGTQYGSGSLINLYNKTALTNITAYSTSAKANANFSYLESNCTYYPSYCQIKCTLEGAPINSQPCSVSTTYGSETLESATLGKTYTATGIFQNHYGNYWYRITTSGGKTGYIYGGEAEYVKMLTPDVTISDYTIPNGHVQGATFYVNGTVKSTYNKLSSVACYIYSGYGTNSQAVTGASDTPTTNTYTLKGSAVDDGTWMGPLAQGTYTYAITAGYTNYYAEGATTLKSNTGTVNLVTDYFTVIPSAADQSTCSHSYTTTTLGASNCTESGTKIQSCSKCGKIVKSVVTAGSHSYGDWTTTTDATCTTAGVKIRTCSKCGNKETQTIPVSGHSYGQWSVTTDPTCTSGGVETRTCIACGDQETRSTDASGHDYDVVTHPATCLQYAINEYTCVDCGNNYKSYADPWSDWQTTEPEAGRLVETKTQYRYSEYQTTTSNSPSLDGYTQIGKEWVKEASATIKYVNSWPSGFNTSHSTYAAYNKKGSKVTNSETDTQKITVDSDQPVGYLWYHWCASGKNTSVAVKDSTYTNFHAFYSTTAPANADKYDSSDGSYKLSSSTACSDCVWYWPIEVYAQTYTTYEAEYTYERWTDWSEWSDTPVEATDTRKVETRVLYSYLDGEKGDHQWVDGICSVCRMACDHSFVDGLCALCGMAEPVKEYYLFGFLNGANYGCEEDYATIGEYLFVDGKLTVEFQQDSYVGIKTGDNNEWYMTDGWQGTATTSAVLHNALELSTAEKLYVPAGREVTFTLTHNEDGTLTLSYVAALPEMPTIDLVAPTLSFKEEVYYKVAFNVINPDQMEIVEMGMVTWTNRIDGTVDDAEHVIPGCENYGTYLAVRSQGIPAKNMGDDLYLKVYLKLDDGSYVYSDLKSYSAKQYAYNQLNAPSSSDDMKALCVALLNFGAAAQEYFEYKTDALMNDKVTMEQQQLIDSYSPDMLPDVIKPDAGKTVELAATEGGFTDKKPSVNFGGAFGINYHFVPAHAVEGEVKLYVWDCVTYSTVDALTLSNASQVISMKDAGSNAYTGRLTGIPAKNVGDTFYVCGVYESGGETYYTGVLPYSLGSYCESMAANSDTMRDLAEATAVYTYYAKIYLTNR